MRQDTNERLAQIGRAAAELKHKNAMRLLATRQPRAEGTPAPVMRLGVRFKTSSR
jgi:hypothetical protein